MISLPKLLTAALAATSVVIAAATPKQVSDGLKTINIINAQLIVIGQGPFPQIITGYTDIINTGTTLVNQIGASGTSKVRRRHATRGAGDDRVFDAYREFVGVNQGLLNILIGKAAILQNNPLVGEPVAAVLRGFEGVADTIAIKLIETYEARVKDLTNEANSLGSTLDLAIQKYEGLQVKK